MKEKIIIANWKMNLDLENSINLAKELKVLLAKESLADKRVILCPSFLALAEVSQELKNTKIILGAQDAFYQDEGAFTGEISPLDLKKLDCQYVIVGHSERRAMGETDKEVNQKAKAVLANDMIPIICVGETLEQRESGQSQEVLASQVSKALQDIENKYFIIAYEPVWAISTSGSGKIISSQEAKAEIKNIKKSIPAGLKNFDILYGGSVNENTVADFTDEFKGALVGGASLKSKIFFQLIKNA